MKLRTISTYSSDGGQIPNRAAHGVPGGSFMRRFQPLFARCIDKSKPIHYSTRHDQQMWCLDPNQAPIMARDRGTLRRVVREAFRRLLALSAEYGQTLAFVHF